MRFRLDGIAVEAGMIVAIPGEHAKRMEPGFTQNISLRPGTYMVTLRVHRSWLGDVSSSSTVAIGEHGLAIGDPCYLFEDDDYEPYIGQGPDGDDVSENYPVRHVLLRTGGDGMFTAEVFISEADTDG